MKEQKFIRASADAWGVKWSVSLSVPGHYPVTDEDGREMLEKAVAKRGPGDMRKPGREVWQGLMKIGRERLTS